MTNKSFAISPFTMPAALAAADEVRYRLATGGGTIARRVLPQHSSMTADQVRAWARSQRMDCKGMLSSTQERALLESIERALVAGGKGGAGSFGHGSARGCNVVTFCLVRVERGCGTTARSAAGT